MKDGFDRSIAERMPKTQKRRPIRPWNVDPVLIRTDDDTSPVQHPSVEETAAHAEAVPVGVQAASSPASTEGTDTVVRETAARAVETIEDIHTDFSQLIFERQDIQRRLQEHDRIIGEYDRENRALRESLARLERTAQERSLLEREITFLNEQIDDADHYIRHVLSLLDSTSAGYDSEITKSRALEERLERVNSELREKAKLDVKVSILEKDLSFSTARIRDLERQLEEEALKRKPLEEEISELKSALDRVYASLAHIRLKAKREVYGS